MRKFKFGYRLYRNMGFSPRRSFYMQLFDTTLAIRIFG